MGHPLRVLTSHGVVASVNSQAFTSETEQNFGCAKCHIHTLRYKHGRQNDHWIPHVCAEQIEKQDKIRPDLQSTPLEESI